LAIYKRLSRISDESEIDSIEDELRDQFGAPPEPVYSLFGLMLIRKKCRDLAVTDLSCGKNSFSIKFSEQTPLNPKHAIQLTTEEPHKYRLLPSNKLRIIIPEVSWPCIYEEVEKICRMV
jgi:transcription-repair coupling factor (superfamily II helicase)